MSSISVRGVESITNRMQQLDSNAISDTNTTTHTRSPTEHLTTYLTRLEILHRMMFRYVAYRVIFGLQEKASSSVKRAYTVMMRYHFNNDAATSGVDDDDEDDMDDSSNILQTLYGFSLLAEDGMDTTSELGTLRTMATSDIHDEANTNTKETLTSQYQDISNVIEAFNADRLMIWSTTSTSHVKRGTCTTKEGTESLQNICYSICDVLVADFAKDVESLLELCTHQCTQYMTWLSIHQKHIMDALSAAHSIVVKESVSDTQDYKDVGGAEISMLEEDRQKFKTIMKSVQEHVDANTLRTITRGVDIVEEMQYDDMTNALVWIQSHMHRITSRDATSNNIMEALNNLIKSFESKTNSSADDKFKAKRLRIQRQSFLLFRRDVVKTLNAKVKVILPILKKLQAFWRTKIKKVRGDILADMGTTKLPREGEHETIKSLSYAVEHIFTDMESMWRMIQDKLSVLEDELSNTS